MDLSVLETLKASGDALKQLGATGQGLRAVEEIVSEVESNLQHASEITSVLSSGSVTGMVNSMSMHGVCVDEDELMKELEEMTESSSHHQESNSPASQQQQHSSSSKKVVVVAENNNSATMYPASDKLVSDSDEETERIMKNIDRLMLPA